MHALAVFMGMGLRSRKASGERQMPRGTYKERSSSAAPLLKASDWAESKVRSQLIWWWQCGERERVKSRRNKKSAARKAATLARLQQLMRWQGCETDTKNNPRIMLEMELQGRSGWPAPQSSSSPLPCTHSVAAGHMIRL